MREETGEKGIVAGWLASTTGNSVASRIVSHSTYFMVSRFFPFYFVLLARAHSNVCTYLRIRVLLPVASVSSSNQRRLGTVIRRDISKLSNSRQL